MIDIYQDKHHTVTYCLVSMEDMLADVQHHIVDHS